MRMNVQHQKVVSSSTLFQDRHLPLRPQKLVHHRRRPSHVLDTVTPPSSKRLRKYKVKRETRTAFGWKIFFIDDSNSNANASFDS